LARTRAHVFFFPSPPTHTGPISQHPYKASPTPPTAMKFAIAAVAGLLAVSTVSARELQGMKGEGACRRRKREREIFFFGGEQNSDSRGASTTPSLLSSFPLLEFVCTRVRRRHRAWPSAACACPRAPRHRRETPVLSLTTLPSPAPKPYNMQPTARSLTSRSSRRPSPSPTSPSRPTST